VQSSFYPRNKCRGSNKNLFSFSNEWFPTLTHIDFIVNNRTDYEIYSMRFQVKSLWTQAFVLFFSTSPHTITWRYDNMYIILFFFSFVVFVSTSLFVRWEKSVINFHWLLLFSFIKSMSSLFSTVKNFRALILCVCAWYHYVTWLSTKAEIFAILNGKFNKSQCFIFVTV
jgi:hypothetical protein